MKFFCVSNEQIERVNRQSLFKIIECQSPKSDSNIKQQPTRFHLIVYYLGWLIDFKINVLFFGEMIFLSIYLCVSKTQNVNKVQQTTTIRLLYHRAFNLKKSKFLKKETNALTRPKRFHRSIPNFCKASLKCATYLIVFKRLMSL